MAFAVSVGGFGFMVGSLANLIALRMARDKRAWLVFHVYSMPFLVAAAGIVFLWMALSPVEKRSAALTGCSSVARAFRLAFTLTHSMAVPAASPG